MKTHRREGEGEETAEEGEEEAKEGVARREEEVVVATPVGMGTTGD